MNQSEQVVVITGAGHKLGAEIAKMFVDYHATVVLAGSKEDAAQATAEQLGVEYCSVDASQLADTTALFQSVAAKYGSVDVLVNYVADECATAATSQDITWDLWHTVIDHDLTRPMLTCIGAAHQMTEQGKGKIVNIVLSPAYFVSPLTNPAYTAAAAGVVDATRNLSRNVVARGINANSIVLGEANEDFFVNANAEEVEAEMNWVPIKRELAPNDIMGAVRLLTSDEGDYIAGAVIDVNGGLYYR